MIAFTYPGQGSQEPAMGSAWAEHPSWEISHEVSSATNRDLPYLLLKADAEELRQTRNSQLASFTMSMVMLDAITRLGISPDCHAGHSLGEFSALVASGVLNLTDAAQLVAERGEAMQMASEEQEGTMAAILGLEDSQVEAICSTCRDEGFEVWVANYNAAGQVVIAGAPTGIEKAAELAKESAAKKTMALKVGGAFHTPFMASASNRLQKALDKIDFSHPDCPVYMNVDAKPYDRSTSFKGLASRQLTSPVLWHSILRQMANDGVTKVVELGAGKALTVMAKRIEGANFELLTINSPKDLDKLLEEMAPPSIYTDGEHLHATERIVVSPRAGVFEPLADLGEGNEIKVGQILGTVSDENVVSPFGGTIMGYLASSLERVVANQPLAWLQTNQLD